MNCYGSKACYWFVRYWHYLFKANWCHSIPPIFRLLLMLLVYWLVCLFVCLFFGVFVCLFWGSFGFWLRWLCLFVFLFYNFQKKKCKKLFASYLLSYINVTYNMILQLRWLLQNVLIHWGNQDIISIIIQTYLVNTQNIVNFDWEYFVFITFKCTIPHPPRKSISITNVFIIC